MHILHIDWNQQKIVREHIEPFRPFSQLGFVVRHQRFVEVRAEDVNLGSIPRRQRGRIHEEVADVRTGNESNKRKQTYRR